MVYSVSFVWKSSKVKELNSTDHRVHRSWKWAVQWRTAIGTFIFSRKDMGWGELEKDNHSTSAGMLFSSENRSSDWEDDFELDNQSTSVAYHLG